MRLVGVSATHVYWPLSLGLRQSRYRRDFVRLSVTDAGSESNVSSSTQLTLLPYTTPLYTLSLHQTRREYSLHVSDCEQNVNEKLYNRRETTRHRSDVAQKIF